jgi:hypothetical protein
LGYLLCERGLKLDTISEYKLGWDADANTLTLPVYAAGALANLRRRRLGPRESFRGLYGRGSQLYPPVPATGGILLVAGEFDALIGRRHGLPAVTATCGASLPDHLAHFLAGRSVHVMYDVGEEAQATRTVTTLHAAGANARIVPLDLPDDGDDLSDWFVKYGRTRNQLMSLIRRTRSAQ